MMRGGKKSVAETITYDALAQVVKMMHGRLKSQPASSREGGEDEGGSGVSGSGLGAMDLLARLQSAELDIRHHEKARNAAIEIFKDALEEQVINIFPDIKGDWRSQQDTTINMCDLHSIYNRQTALVAAKYICKYFDKEKYGDSNKNSFRIIVGRGRFQEENVYSKIICKYLDYEQIQHHTKSGVIYLNWPSVMKWRNS